MTMLKVLNKLIEPKNMNIVSLPDKEGSRQRKDRQHLKEPRLSIVVVDFKQYEITSIPKN